MMEDESTQMSLLPDAVEVMHNAMPVAARGEDEIDLGEYEIVRPEFFAHIKEPALTVNVDKIGVNTACVRLMPEYGLSLCSLEKSTARIVILLKVMTTSLSRRLR